MWFMEQFTAPRPANCCLFSVMFTLLGSKLVCSSEKCTVTFVSHPGTMQCGSSPCVLVMGRGKGHRKQSALVHTLMQEETIKGMWDDKARKRIKAAEVLDTCSLFRNLL